MGDILQDMRMQQTLEWSRQQDEEYLNRPVWLVWHRECRDVAFGMRKDPRTTPINSEDVVLFNLSRPPYGSEMRCESCGQPIKKHDLLAEQPPPLKKIIVGEPFRASS